MSWQTLSFLIPYLISAVISIGIGLYAWRRRDVAGAVAFSMGALSQAAWTLGYVFELASPGLEAKIFWDDVQFIAASISPLTFLAFAFQYTGRKSPHPRRTFALLAIPLIIFVLLVPTDDLHGLIRPAAWLVPGQPFPALVYDFTALVKVVTLYGLGLIVTGILMLTLFLARSPSLYRAQAGVIILGALFPLVGTALTLAGITLGFHRDTTPFTFAIRNLLIAWGLFRYRLFDVVPVARDKVIESMGDAVVVLDARNRLVDLNPATQELIGQPASEAIGQPAAQVFSAWSDLVKRYREVGEAREEIILGVGKRRRYFDLRLSPLRNHRGRLTGQLIVVRDITERKEAEEALQKSEERYRSLVANIPDIVWTTDQMGRTVFVSPSVGMVYGYTPEEIYQAGDELWLDRIHPDDNARVREAYESLFAGTATYDVEYRIQHKDGHWIWLHDRAIATHEKDGAMCTDGVFSDITARKQAEDALQRAHDELERRVEKRTAELAEANTSLKAEIAEREQAEEALHRHTERLSILHEIDQGILAAQSPKAIAQATVSRIRQLIPCQRAGVVLINAETGEAEILAVDAEIESQIAEDARIRLDQLGDVVETLAQGKIAVFEDLQSRGEVMETLYAEGVRLSTNVPLMFRGDLIGALTFWMTDRDTFTPEDEDIARQLADQLAIAIQQTRLYEQIQRYADELEERVADRTRELWAMYEVMTIASQSVDLEATLGQSLKRVLEAVKSNAGVIHILEPEERTLRLAVQRGIPTDILPQITSLPAENLGEWVGGHSEAILVPEITSDPRIADPTIRLRRYVGLPMRAGGQVLGVLGVLKETTQPEFSDEEIALLTSLADRVGAVVESHRLRERAERSAVMEERQRLARDLHDSVTQSIYSLTLLAETGRRAARVGDLESVVSYIGRLGEVALQALKEMRLLIYELRPPLLEQEGLVGALQQRLDAVEGRAGVEARLLVEGEGQLAAAVEEDLYRIALEALNNALKHAAATSVTVRISSVGDCTELEVTDSGRGFDPQAVANAGGLGLVTMRERAERSGGTLDIISAPGEGTAVRVAVSRSR